MNAELKSTHGLAPLAAVPLVSTGDSSHDAWRTAARGRLIAGGLPTPRDDAWKYSSLNLIQRRDLSPCTDYSVPAQLLASLPERQGVTFVCINGQLIAELSSGALPAGVRYTPLNDLFDSPIGAMQARLRADDSADQRLKLLNAVCCTSGVAFDVSAHQTPVEPVHLVHIATHHGHDPRTLVTLQAGSRLNLIEYYLSMDDSNSVSVPVTDIQIEHGAALQHTTLGLAGANSVVYADVTAHVGPDASYIHRSLELGGLATRLDLKVHLDARGAEATLNGLLLADKTRQIDIRTSMEHRAPNTTSSQTYRGVANDRGRGSYDGKVVVHRGAAKSDSRQSSRNLLLGPKAEIDARPQLEINADDVKCSHGATTGSIDEEVLFYLLSRGIDHDTARALLIFAFTDDVIATLTDPALRHAVEKRVLASLPTAALIRDFVQ